MDQTDLSLDLLLQETLAMSEYLRTSNSEQDLGTLENPSSDRESSFDQDYLFDLADKFSETPKETPPSKPQWQSLEALPIGSGIIYKIDRGSSTFCVRGFTSENIKSSFEQLLEGNLAKRVLLKCESESDFSEVHFFSTASIELAEAIREQVLNRRFPFQEDAVCNISDPGFSWWMNVDPSLQQGGAGRFEIYFRSHGINRADKYIQLGPIGDGAIAALRLNQALSLLKSSFPISEYSCDDKCFIVASAKPDHLSFNSFKNIFLYGENTTAIENFPDNVIGKTLYFYFHELAIVRKFWIEVKNKLG